MKVAYYCGVLCAVAVVCLPFLFWTKEHHISSWKLVGLPVEPVVAGVSESFIISTNRSGLIWSIRFVGPVLASSTCISDEGNGVYKVHYMLPQPGTYTVEIYLMFNHVNTTSACTAYIAGKRYKMCNPKAQFHTRIDSLPGCGHEKWGSSACLQSSQAYTACMEKVGSDCNFPRLLQERLPVNRAIVVKGMGFVTASTSRPCTDRSEVLGPGFWVNTTQLCSSYIELGYDSFSHCQQSVFPCVSGSPSVDGLAGAICGTALRWRPEKCYLRPVSPSDIATSGRRIVMYGISTTAEVNLVMNTHYPGLSTIARVPSSAELVRGQERVIDWSAPNTTFFLTACGILQATGLTTESNFYQNETHNASTSCRRFLHKIRSARNRGPVDVLLNRHPVNYPRRISAPDDWAKSYGRYAGTRGYMSVNELMTDFHAVLMSRFIDARVPVNGVLDGQGMTAPLRHNYGDALHYNFVNVNFVLHTYCLLLVNAIMLPSFLASPALHDPSLNRCPLRQAAVVPSE